MADFNASLLREKLTIYEPDAGESGALSKDGRPVIALSNRIVAELRSANGRLEETLVIRAHTMHLCVRMCARILSSFRNSGPLMNRPKKFEWESAWDTIVNNYEHAYNPQRWTAVYHKGRPVFHSGEYHPFLDILEQCNVLNESSYDNSVPLAEDIFKQAGKSVSIEHDANVALVVDLGADKGRCSIILRGPDKTTTFSFTAYGTKKSPLNHPQCLMAAAAFLEGVQLAFMVGMNTEKIRLGIIERHTKEEKQTIEARRRLSRLNAEIANLESACEVRYRPERPEFPHLVIDAENLAKKILKPPPKKEKEKTERKGGENPAA